MEAGLMDSLAIRILIVSIEIPGMLQNKAMFKTLAELNSK